MAAHGGGTVRGRSPTYGSGRAPAGDGPTDRFPWWATGEALMPTAVSRMTQRIICGTDRNSGIGPLVRHGMPLAKPRQGFQKSIGLD